VSAQTGRQRAEGVAAAALTALLLPALRASWLPCCRPSPPLAPKAALLLSLTRLPPPTPAGILAAAAGREIESIYAGSNKGILADVDMLQRITEASRATVREFVKDRTGFDGRIGNNIFAQFAKFTGFYQEPWVRALTVSGGAPPSWEP